MNKRQRKKKLQKSCDHRFSARIREILILITDEYEKFLTNEKCPDLTDELSDNLYSKILLRIDERNKIE